MNLLKPRRKKLLRILFLLAVLSIPLITVGYSSLQTILNFAVNVYSDSMVTVIYDCSSGTSDSFADYAVPGDGYNVMSTGCGSMLINDTATELYNQVGWSLTDGGISVSVLNLTNNTILYPVWEINNPAAPTITGGATKVYNYEDTTLTCASSTIYDESIDKYYQFGYSTTSGGEVTWIGSASTEETYTVPKNEYMGTRYYTCRVYARDSVAISNTVPASVSATMTLQRVKITFNATTNSGTLSGTSPLYAEYGNGSLYTTATGSTTANMPTASKTGYTWNGWYTASSSGSQVANTTPALTGTAVTDWSNTSNQWVITSPSDQTLYAQFTPYTYALTRVTGTNILSNGDFQTVTVVDAPTRTANNVTHTWDIALNGIPGNTSKAYSASGWGTGANMGVAIPEIGYHAHMLKSGSNYLFRYKTNEAYVGKTKADVSGGVTVGSESAITANRWLGIAQSVTATSLSANSTYTISAEIYRVSGNTYLTGGPYFSTTANSTNSFVLGQYSMKPVSTGTWEHHSWAFTLPSNYSTGTNPGIYFYGMNGAPGELYLDNVKLQASSTVTASKSYDSNFTSTELATPTRTGYTFNGWYNTPTYTTQLTTSSKLTISTASFADVNTNNTSVNIYAKWTANTNTVSFNANGGSGGQSANVTATYDSAMPTISTTAPTRTGYTFGGWYDTSAATGGTQYYTAAGASARTWNKTANTILYARWTINNPATPTITGGATKVYNYQDTTLTCASSTTYASGTNKYYQFGYSTTSGGTVTWVGSASTTATYSVTKASYLGTRYWTCRVYASDGTYTSGTVAGATSTTMTLQRVKITFNATTNSGTLSGTSPLYVQYGSGTLYTTATGSATANMPTASRAGWAWGGWYTASSSGSQVANTTPALTGVAVSGWTNTSKQWVITTTSDKTLYAQYQTTTHVVTYNCNGGLGTAPSPTALTSGTAADLTSRDCGYKITAGTGTGTSATPALSYQTGWATSSGGAALSSYTPTGNVTLYATFGKLFTYSGNYTVTSEGSGNWNVQFKNSGTLTMNGALSADVHLVGGGGGGCNHKYDDYYSGTSGCGGGGGGYTNTKGNVSITAGSYTITVGAGGAAGAYNNNNNAGGTGTASSAFGYSANGGQGGQGTSTGGAGGSGGAYGGYGSYHAPGWAGSDGGNARKYAKNEDTGHSSDVGANGGTGQGNSTRDFWSLDHNTSATLRSGGGGGGGGLLNGNGHYGSDGGAGGGGKGASNKYSQAAVAGTDNYGGGGGGGCYQNNAKAAAGGSGIVIIRNARYPNKAIVTTKIISPTAHTITFSCTGGNNSSTSRSITSTTGEAAPVNICGEKIVTGNGINPNSEAGIYYQTGWSTTDGGNVYSSYYATSNVTLYSVWTKKLVYSNNYTVINDGSNNWRMELKDSGTLKVNLATNVDAHLVGGGGGGANNKFDDYYSGTNGGSGGGSGYTRTQKNITLSATSYTVTVGAGGAAGTYDRSTFYKGSDGGATTAFGYTANGGQGGQGVHQGGNGGSGGGYGGYYSYHGPGWAGSDGGNARKYAKNEDTGHSSDVAANGGDGQGTTTRDFAESTGTLRAGGGGGGGSVINSTVMNGTAGGSGGGGAGAKPVVDGTSVAAGSGTANYGGGGGGGCFYNKAYAGAGGSGIVIIRNKR